MINKVRIIIVQLILIFIASAMLITDSAFALYSDVDIVHTSIKTAEKKIEITNLVVKDKENVQTQEIGKMQAVTISIDVVNKSEESIICYGDMEIAFHDNSLLESNSFFVYPFYFDEEEIYDMIVNEMGHSALLGFNPPVSDFSTSVGIREGISFMFCKGVNIRANSKVTFQYKLYFLESSIIEANSEYYDNQPLEIILSINGYNNGVQTADLQYSDYYILNTKLTVDKNPIINLYGDNPYILPLYGIYEEPGFEAFDYLGNSIPVIVYNNINSNVIGDYVVTYIAFDENDNETTVKRVVSVVELPKPKIVVKEGASFELAVDDEHDLKSLVVAIDHQGKDISEQITVNTEESYDSYVAGEYVVYYNVTDDNGIAANQYESSVEVYDIIKTSSSGSHSIVIGSNGKVYVYGDNGFGQLGLGFYSENEPTTHSLEYFNNIKIVDVLAMNNSSFALDDEGRVYSWGQGNTGELSHDVMTCYSVPTLLKDIGERIVSIVVKDDAIIGTTEEGNVYSSKETNKNVVEPLLDEDEIETKESEIEEVEEFIIFGHYPLTSLFR
jgi:Alpha-tubulin suppressor and related RCC1 domain-containing proteins